MLESGGQHKQLSVLLWKSGFWEREPEKVEKLWGVRGVVESDVHVSFPKWNKCLLLDHGTGDH